jgi:hypothetical protein
MTQGEPSRREPAPVEVQRHGEKKSLAQLFAESPFKGRKWILSDFLTSCLRSSCERLSPRHQRPLRTHPAAVCAAGGALAE